MPFITLGNYTINTDAIAYINWNEVERTYVYMRVSEGAGREEPFGPAEICLGADSLEVHLLKEYFENTLVTVNLVKQHDRKIEHENASRGPISISSPADDLPY